MKHLFCEGRTFKKKAYTGIHQNCQGRFKHLPGNFPPGSSINAIITRTIQQAGYSVEKIIFESFNLIMFQPISMVSFSDNILKILLFNVNFVQHDSKRCLYIKIVNLNNEYELLLSIANGSEQAFSKLFDRYKNEVYAHALHFTQSVFIAEEITQDVFLKCWLKKELMVEIKNLEAWLFTITKNCCFNQLKKIAREHRLKNSIAQTDESADESIEAYLSVKEQQNLLQQAIDFLSAKQKLVFELNRKGGMKNAEIAEQLNISPNTVKTHMVSAIRSIRLFFKTHTERAVQILLLLHFIK